MDPVILVNTFVYEQRHLFVLSAVLRKVQGILNVIMFHDEVSIYWPLFSKSANIDKQNQSCHMLISFTFKDIIDATVCTINSNKSRLFRTLQML